MLTYKIYNSPAEAANEWHSYVDQDSSMHLNELGLEQRSLLPNLKFYYVVTYVGGLPVMLSYYQHLNVTPEHFNCQDKVFQQYSLNVSLRLVKPSLLVVGNLFRHDRLFFEFLKIDMSNEEQAQIFKQTFEHVFNYSKAAGIFVKDVPARCADKILLDDTYKQMLDDMSMVLYLPKEWESLTDYEKSLKHKYAQRFRKIKKQQDGLEIQLLDEAQLVAYQHDIEALYMQVSDNQLVSMGKINHTFFVEMKKALGDRFRVFGWFEEGRMVAFSSAILHNGVYDMNYIGFDYSVNHSHSIYFNILFHCLEQAIATQSRKLILGRTALEAKAILGCIPEEQYSFYKLRHVVVNWFFKKVSAGFKEQIGEKWRDRHPFKSSYYQSAS